MPRIAIPIKQRLPLEKFEFAGLFDGLADVIIIQNHMPLNHLRVLDPTKSILVA